MNNQFGKTSRCSIGATYDSAEQKTILREVSYTAPFKVMTPFYEKPDWMHVMLLAASAGIMEGDCQEFNLTVQEGAHLRFSAQAYEKIHRMKEGSASRKTTLTIADGGYMDFFSQPVIPFADSAFSSELEANLEGIHSFFSYREILSCGRVAYGEEFAYRYYHNLVSVRREGKLLYRDNCYFDPKQMDLSEMGYYEGYHHYGTCLLFGRMVTDSQIHAIRELLDEDSEITGGVTQLSPVDTVIRLLGNRAQHLEAVFQNIEDMLEGSR